MATATTVDTVLSLVIDVSGSVDSAEYNTQVQGYVNAFNDSAVQDAIIDKSDGRVGAIAVNVVQFASSAVEAIGFTILDADTDASNFASALSSMARSGSVGGLTDIADGITGGVNSITGWLATAGNSATRRVIDVSGDGSDNSGASPFTAGANFCGSGGVINGVAILTDDDALDTYYENNVVCGGGFVLAASGFDTFGDAIKTKLRAEISGEDPTDPAYIPLPAAGWLLIGGIGGLVALRRKKAA